MELTEIGKGSKKNQKTKKVPQKILKHFTNHEKKLSNCFMIILEFYLKPNTKKKKKYAGLKILTPKQMVQRLIKSKKQVKYKR